MNVYLSIPVVIYNRDKVIDSIADTIYNLDKDKNSLTVNYWSPGESYNNSYVKRSDIFIFTHPGNAFKFNISTLPSGVLREYLSAKASGKKIYLAYKTISDGIKFYNLIETCGTISGISGTTGDLATFLDKSIEYAPKEEIYNDDEPFLKFMTNSLPAKEHSIDLRKNVLDTSYDRRLLL